MKAPIRKPVTIHEAVSAKVDGRPAPRVDECVGVGCTYSGRKISSNGRNSWTGDGGSTSAGFRGLADKVNSEGVSSGWLVGGGIGGFSSPTE